MSGSGIRKLKKDMEKKGNFNDKKNLAKNTPDEQHTTTTSEETVNEISGELANKAFMAANRKYQYADNNLTREKAYKQQKKFSGYASKKYQKLNKDRGDLNKIYNKPDAVKEETISELNKYEKMQAAKKRAAVKAVTGGRISKASSQKIKDQISTERSNPKNPFTSQMRSAENKTNAHLRKIGKRQRDNSSMNDSLFADKPKNFTKDRHRGTRRLSKTKQSKHFKAGVGFKPASDDSRDANAQLSLKPAPGLNKNSGDAMISRQFNTNRMGKPSTKNIKKGSIPEAKMPVQGLMKLAATVAANNKKRKNALQIQKYIGEETPDAISGKDLKRISALSGKKTRFGDGPEGTAKRKAALEKKRGMKLDDHPQFKTEIEEGRRGQSKSAYGRNPYDNVTSSVKKITRTGIGPGIEHYSDDEKKKSEKEKIKDAKDPKKNMSRERATQNMQMIKRMTPEQKYARKMRIEKQKKDKK